MIRIHTLVSALVFLGLAATLFASPATASTSVEQHMENLDAALDARVAAVMTGHHDPKAWQALSASWIELAAQLRRDGDGPREALAHASAKRVQQLQRLATTPDELKAQWLRFKRGRAAAPASASPDQKIDFFEISGRVTASFDGAPLPNILVTAYEQNSSVAMLTDSDGRYSFQVTAGSYTVTAESGEYFDEAYDDFPCEDTFCVFPDGTILSTEDAPHTNIDFQLAREPVIRGRVTAAGSGDGLEGIAVTAWQSEFFFLSSTFTDADGIYEIGGLDRETYFVVAQGSGYQSEVFDDVPCGNVSFGLDNCPLQQAQALNVAGNGDERIEDIDFALEVNGTISGRVTDSMSGQGLPFTTVYFQQLGGGDSAATSTDENGFYESPAIHPGNYYVHTENFDQYIDEIYDDVPCRREFGFIICDQVAATLVPVQLRQETSDIDLALDIGGSITGTLTQNNDGAPIPFAFVILYSETGRQLQSVSTDEQGRYEFSGLAGGQYRVVSQADQHFNEVWDDLRCMGPFDCGAQLLSGDLIPVQVSQATAGIDFALDRFGTLTGRVVDRESGDPIPNATVRAYDADNLLLAGIVNTDANGNYAIGDLFLGEYVVLADDNFGPYLPALYPNISCPFRSCDFSQGQRVSVPLNTTTRNVDISLEVGGSLSGRIFDRLTGAPIVFGSFDLYNTSSALVASAAPDNEGHYRFDGLPQGQYFLIANNFATLTHVYGRGDCGNNCDPLSGTPISIEKGVETTGIDMGLQVINCMFDGRDMCFGANRFRAVVKWRDGAGAEGYGFTTQLTLDSSSFWFFDDQNIEGIVKVLNACSAPFDRYWVFAAGLTNVETTIWVTDLTDLESRVYTSPLGQAFVPVQDTQAFDSCAFGRSSEPSGVVDTPALAPPLEATAGLPTKNCGATNGELCLNNGRFAVRAFYRVPGGTEQQAGTGFLTNDSGYFWFFDFNNLEVLIKVLDACTFSDRFWVFGAGLTNVEVRLEVTDTMTNEVKEYVNNQGDVFQPIQDTQAFETCF